MRYFQEIRSKAISETGKDPYVAFMSHKRGSETRGIPFQYDFLAWWKEWEPKFAERGRSSKSYAMCRHGDRGPYAPGNVRIGTTRSNVEEYQRNKLVRDVKDAWDFDGEDRSDCVDWMDRYRRPGK